LRSGFQGNEGSWGQAVNWHNPGLLFAGPVLLVRAEAFGVKNVIYLAGIIRVAQAEEVDKFFVSWAAALPTGPVSGGQGGGLIEEEEFSVGVGKHEFAFNPLPGFVFGFKAADNPMPVLVIAPQVFLVIMQNAAIAHAGATIRHSQDVAKRVDPVLERHTLFLSVMPHCIITSPHIQ
jgi:hypothetical protein